MAAVVLAGLFFLSRSSQAFVLQPPPASSSSSSLVALSMVAVDPTVLSKQEYQDVCGLDFDQETMEQRLQATNYLYPQHVQVISELEPVAQEMVDDVVRFWITKRVWGVTAAVLLSKDGF